MQKENIQNSVIIPTITQLDFFGGWGWGGGGVGGLLSEWNLN